MTPALGNSNNSIPGFVFLSPAPSASPMNVVNPANLAFHPLTFSSSGNISESPYVLQPTPLPQAVFSPADFPNDVSRNFGFQRHQVDNSGFDVPNKLLDQACFSYV